MTPLPSKSNRFRITDVMWDLMAVCFANPFQNIQCLRGYIVFQADDKHLQFSPKWQRSSPDYCKTTETGIMFKGGSLVA